MMGGYRPLQRRLQAAVCAPLLGPALYRLNVTRPLIAAMFRRHVYADADRVTPDLVRGKQAVARRPGGRFGSAAFVTGGLDLIRDRDRFLALAREQTSPVLVIYGPQTPPRSRAEMEALAMLPCIQTHCLHRGSLGVHEESPWPVAAVIRPFLQAA